MHINDCVDNNEMVEGEDYEIVSSVHSEVGRLMLGDVEQNLYLEVVQDLMDQGVVFYMCWNTVNAYISKGVIESTDDLVEGLQFVPQGVGAICDFPIDGYVLRQP